MLNLILAITFPVLSVILFKIFERYKVNNLQAIVFNYLIAFTLCFLLSLNGNFVLSDILDKEWLLYSVVVGILFIVNFQLIAVTAQKVNIATATLANKISLIIPVIASFIVFQENLPIIKIGAILGSFIAIYLIITDKGRIAIPKKYWHYPLLIFCLTGIMEFIISYVQRKLFTQENEIALFTAVTFLLSFIIGLIILIPQIKKVTQKNIAWGSLLGIPNALGVYFLFLALDSGIHISVTFPIIHTGSLLLAVFAGYLFFKERLSLLNWIGLFLAFITIFILSI